MALSAISLNFSGPRETLSTVLLTPCPGSTFSGLGSGAYSGKAGACFGAGDALKVPNEPRRWPMTRLLIRALVGRAIVLGEIAFAAALCFWAFIACSELVKSLLFNFKTLNFLPKGSFFLQASKSGLRTGSQEAVAIRDTITLQVLDTLVSLQPCSPGNKLWPHSAQFFRDTLKRYLEFFHVSNLGMKIHSAVAALLFCSSVGNLWNQF